MAADDFSMTVAWVYPLDRDFYNVRSQSESGKIEVANIATSSTKRFRLLFKGLSNTDYATLRTHYDTQLGGYDEFSWTNPPASVSAGALTGRWVDGSWTVDPLALGWNVELTFEVSN